MSEGSQYTCISAHLTCHDGPVACFAPDAVFNEIEDGFKTNQIVRDASHLIFLVDSSGSMIEVWPFVARGINAITVTRPNAHVLKWANIGIERRSPLIENLRDCEKIDKIAGESTGYGTNITQSAVVLRTKLKHLLNQEGVSEFIVVFVSDGNGSTDGLESTLRDISKSVLRPGINLEMTTIGVGAGFPTHIAMSMRNILHNGRHGVPLCSVVDSSDEFQEALDGLAGYIAPRLSCAYLLEPSSLRSLPWESDNNLVQAGVAFLLPQKVDNITLTVDAKKREKPHSKDFNVVVTPWNEADLTTIAKQFIWALQSESLHGRVESEKIKERAHTALSIINYGYRELAAKDSFTGTAGKMSVRDRVLRKLERGALFMLDAMRKELKMLASGSPLDELSDIELAQRIAIGTMEGKFHQRSMTWKGLSDSEFESRMKAFRALLADEAKVAAVAKMVDFETNAGLRSAISLDSNAEILTQPDLANALNGVSSQYFLVDVLPLCGLALNLVRQTRP